MDCVSAFFSPKSVAIVGATDKMGIGRNVVANIKAELPLFNGAVYPINPTRTSVLGIPCFPSLDKCPTLPELVVIVTPAKTVPDIVAQCVDLKVKSIIVISAGFKEIGPAGQALENQISAHLKRGGNYTRLVGPNCFGIMDMQYHLNATFAATMYPKGKVAFLSQSGATMVCLMDWAAQRKLGFRAAVSIGSMLDVNWSDLLKHFGEDEETKGIVIYMESIGDARAFLSAARSVSLKKPIVVLKAGRTSAAAKAAMSHTGSLAGSDSVLDAAFERAGVIRVDTLSDLMTMIEVLNFSPIPKGPNMIVVSHAGGPAVLAADAISRYGAQLANIPDDVITSLDPVLPNHWSRGNPMDITGGASPEHYQKCLDAVRDLKNVDGVLVFCGPLAICAGSSIAQIISSFAQECPDKTVLACFMGGDELVNGTNILLRKGIPCFLQSDTACRMFATLWNYRKHLDEIHAAPRQIERPFCRECGCGETVDKILNEVNAQNRSILTEAESKLVLSAYGIPISTTTPAKTVEEAQKIAKSMGFPVVIKLLSETITHKSDVGGVILNVQSEEEVAKAFKTINDNIAKIHPTEVAKHFLGVTVQPMLDTNNGVELLLGSSNDIQFGPVVVFGAGGKMVEIFHDSALSLPPIDSVGAQILMKKTKIYKALLGARGMKPVDQEKLETILASFSALVSSHPLIKEIDINPLFASGDRICAIDARVVIFSKDDQHRPGLALAPYPFQYKTKIGTDMIVRPLCSEDHELFLKWMKEGDSDSFHCFFGKDLPVDVRSSHQTAIDMIYMEYDQAIMLAAVNKPTKTIIAGARLVRKAPSVFECSFAIPQTQVATEAGSALIKQAIAAAKSEGATTLVCKIAKLTKSGKSIAEALTSSGAKEENGSFILSL
eukprot:TRINITY_DN6307_c0_g1_i1.p1 TRINITY_DN6307_c0_g1~~TRINITY_DN6307_c0_g1_i1.p1  ORF type:complete len:898 (+),score=307.96 TRINITY_DN6307_c0_g1_i1:22-2694(+)